MFEVMEMRLDISRLMKHPGSSMPFDLRESLENLQMGGERMDFTEPVHVRGECMFTGKDFSVDGRITAHYTATCSRCTKDVAARLDIPFRALFSRQQQTQEDPDIYIFEGNVIDLGEMAVDELLTNAPIRHLCSPDCLGLCPVCGVDRNIQSCDCVPQNSRENPFVKIKDLISDDKGDHKEV